VVGLFITKLTLANIHFYWRFTMHIKSTFFAAITAVVLLSATGCAVNRGQETVGAYVDDTGITTLVKARFVENTFVDASSIRVETLNGTVMLSGFAKSVTEKDTAEGIARGVKGVKSIKNEISVRP
jgi:hyperosmotically inducible protein